MTADSLAIADRTFASRLIVGTGKYPSHQVMADAHAAAATGMVTVAVRRLNFTNRSAESLLHYIDTSRIFLLPNTAGCYTAEEAIRTARLEREVGLSDWVKLESRGGHDWRGARRRGGKRLMAAARLEVAVAARPPESSRGRHVQSSGKSAD